MILSPGGIDIFYIDESVRTPLYTVSAVTVPFLRPNRLIGWKFVWPEYHGLVQKWRRDLSRDHSVLFRKELHAYQLVKSQGLLHKAKRNLSPVEAVALYKSALAKMDFLPDASLLTAYATDKTRYAGEVGIGACLIALFQRMRTQCSKRRTNGLVFFDEGHSEYLRAFRKAQKFLPTGSKFGGWNGKGYKNIPLSMFPQDANFKSSEFSYFLQMADLVAYAARIKLEYEKGALAAKRVGRKHHELYDALPSSVINLESTRYRKDGIFTI